MAVFVGAHKFRSLDGDFFSVKVPPPGDRDGFFVFSLPKAGSTLLDGIMRDLCDAVAMPYITIANDAFSRGVSLTEIPQSIECVLAKRGYAYLGFRHFFAFEPRFDFSDTQKILLVRDPRDMLVSLYFSLRNSHVIPRTGDASEKLKRARKRTRDLEIDAYITRQSGLYRRLFARYRRFIHDDNLRLYRYEDVVFKKREWVADINDYLALGASDAVIDVIAKRHDIVPERENPRAHIRQVSPGNYKKHLNDASIETLNRLFATELDFYGYES